MKFKFLYLSVIVSFLAAVWLAVCSPLSARDISQPYGYDSVQIDRFSEGYYASLSAHSHFTLAYVIESLYQTCKSVWEVDSGFSPQMKTTLEEVYANRMQIKDDSVVFSLLVRNIVSFSAHGRQVLCVELINNVLLYYQQEQRSDNPQITNYIGRLYVMLGAGYEEVGFWRQALNIYRRAMALVDREAFVRARPVRAKELKAMLYNNMGNIYLKQQDYEKAIGFYMQAIVINTELNLGKELFNNYNNMAEVELVRNNLTKALEYAFLAQQQTDIENDPYGFYFIQCNISQIYLMQEKLEIAWEYMSDGLDYMRDNGHNMDYGYGCLFAARLWQKKGDKEKTLYYLEEAERIAQQLENRNLIARVYGWFSDYYYRCGRSGDAYLYLKKSAAVSDSIRMLDDAKRLSDMELVYEVEKVVQENSLLGKEAELKDLRLRRQRLIIILIGVFCAMVLCVVVWWVWSQRRHRMAERRMAEHEAQLKDMRLKNMQQRQTDLKNELEIKNRELTSKVLKLVRNNEFILRLTEELKQLLLELNPRDNAKREHIRELLTQLRLLSNNNSDTEFKYYFEQVYSSFYDNLLKAFPSLTAKDLRLCAFLRLGLSTKEISVITFREVRSVESSRNRLRKKMNIPAETDLTEFFSRF